MPDGARVLGARFYYYDANANNTMAFYLTDYTGLGVYRDLLSGMSSDGGFGSLYVAMGASYDPYVVDQGMYALNAIAVGADQAALQLCGVRVFYQTASEAAGQPNAEVAPDGAVPGSPSRDLGENANDLVALTPKAFAHDLQLPQGAMAEGLRVYYYNTRTPNGYVETWSYNGAVAEFLGSTVTTGHSGFGSTYQAFTTPYPVDHAVSSLGVVPWLIYNPTYAFCGVRVFYREGSTSRYRFIAGSAFHPRSSTTHYVYEGTGCIGVAQSFTFVPIIVR